MILGIWTPARHFFDPNIPTDWPVKSIAMKSNIQKHPTCMTDKRPPFDQCLPIKIAEPGLTAGAMSMHGLRSAALLT